MIRISQCSYCSHLIVTTREEMLKLWTCDAFPGGIPRDLERGKVIHNKPYPGDHGIVFEQDPDNPFKFDIEKAAEESEKLKSGELKGFFDE